MNMNLVDRHQLASYEWSIFGMGGLGVIAVWAGVELRWIDSDLFSASLLWSAVGFLAGVIVAVFTAPIVCWALQMKKLCVVGPVIYGFGAVLMFVYVRWFSLDQAWFPLIDAALFASIWVVIASSFIRYTRLGNVRGPGRCPQCDYDLRGTPAGCPECGWGLSKYVG